MRPYAAILSARLRGLLQYRTAAVAGFATQLFWGFIRMMVLVAFYEGATHRPPLSLEQGIAYIWLGQAFLLLAMLGPDADIQELIRGGNIAYEMLRPLDLYTQVYVRVLAGRVAPVLLRAGPLLAIAALAGFLPWPGAGPLAAFAAATVAAALLSAAIATIMTLSMFWTLSGIGVTRLLAAGAYFLGGLVVPLPLFPDRWQGVLRSLPFAGLCDTPFRLFVGHAPLTDLPGLLARQLAWTAAAVGCGRYLLSRATRRLVVQGG